MGSDSEDNEEKNYKIDNDSVVTKYKMAGDITTKVLKEVIGECVPGKKIVEICLFGDRRITEETSNIFKKDKEMKKGLAFPTCVNINNIICYYSPLSSDTTVPTVSDGDMVKISLGVHIDGLPIVVSHTFVVGASRENPVTGKKADVILAAHTLSEACQRLFRIKNDSIKINEWGNKIVDEFDCKLIEGFQSHTMDRNVFLGAKSVSWNPNEEQRKQLGKQEVDLLDVWHLYAIVSSGEGKPRESDYRTTVFRKNDIIYNLRMKASRQFIHEATSRFQSFPFSINAFADEKIAKVGSKECLEHDLIEPLRVYQEKEGEFVAEFQLTLLVYQNGPMVIGGLPFDDSIYQSSHSIKSEEVKNLLAEPVRSKNKKSKKTASNNH